MWMLLHSYADANFVSHYGFTQWYPHHHSTICTTIITTAYNFKWCQWCLALSVLSWQPNISTTAMVPELSNQKAASPERKWLYIYINVYHLNKDHAMVDLGTLLIPRINLIPAWWGYHIHKNEWGEITCGSTVEVSTSIFTPYFTGHVNTYSCGVTVWIWSFYLKYCWLTANWDVRSKVWQNLNIGTLAFSLKTRV